MLGDPGLAVVRQRAICEGVRVIALRFGPFRPQPFVVAALGVSPVRVRRPDAVAEVDDDVGVLDRGEDVVGGGIGRIGGGNGRAARLGGSGGGLGEGQVDRRQLLTDRPDDDGHLGRRGGAERARRGQAGEKRCQQRGDDKDRTRADPPGTRVFTE